MIAMRRTDDLTVRTLHAAVDFIVEKSGQDICKICTYYCEKSQAKEIEKDEDIDPCVWHRKQGNLACREGIIEKFQIELTGVQG